MLGTCRDRLLYPVAPWAVSMSELHAFALEVEQADGPRMVLDMLFIVWIAMVVRCVSLWLVCYGLASVVIDLLNAL